MGAAFTRPAIYASGCSNPEKRHVCRAHGPAWRGLGAGQLTGFFVKPACFYKRLLSQRRLLLCMGRERFAIEYTLYATGHEPETIWQRRFGSYPSGQEQEGFIT